MYTVNWKCANRQGSFTAEEGGKLLDALRNHGIALDAPCGGKGTCGKCLVRVDGGDWTKACQTAVNGDMEVELPDGAEVSEISRNANILLNSTQRAVELKPALSRKKTDGSWKVFYEDEKLLSQEKEPHLYAAAVDIGTTTLAAYLINLETGERIATASALNPQAAFGADVIARAEYALNGGNKELAGLIRGKIDELVGQMTGQVGLSKTEVLMVVLVGNTTMNHLFMDISTETLVKAPYTPAHTAFIRANACEYGIQINPAGQMLWLPNISGFVGADTDAVLVAADYAHREKVTLFIDIGTNGEMGLGDKNGVTVCSTAAGPAFEGAKITCGMRGAAGAVDHVSFDEETQDLKCTVIGDTEAVGLCGSGLMDTVAVLLDTGVIDEMGGFNDPDEIEYEAVRNRLFERDGMKAIRLSDNGRVFFTQKDVREVQLAKAAIAAGIQLLLSHTDRTFDDIEEVLIAGAFGSYMSPDSACRIGLIQPVLRPKIRAVGNAAGEGAVLSALNRDCLAEGIRLAREAGYIELATDEDFMDIYVEEMEFPE